MEEQDKFSLLIVDDEKMNLMVLNRILSAEYNIFTAKSGLEALVRLERVTPDLMLMDILMPGMSGFEVIKKLKASPFTSEIPVIFITGLNSVESEEKGLEMGAVDYITKPFKNTLVRMRVKTHIQMLKNLRTIEKIGLLDPLTEVPNRRNFDKRMEVEFKRAKRDGRRVSFLMIDIDYFKRYNDTYGHLQGDVLLKEVAQLIAAEAKRPADMTVRLGGEEFGVLLPDTSLEAALVVAERARTSIESAVVPVVDTGKGSSVTVSIGVSSILPNQESTSNQLIGLADKCLYEAKNSGRNRIKSSPVN
ncbi:MAG: diguanylate cyclase [Clostridiales bacterium]|jgi:diguanylate cyclase (GGDEF)-like protein|nr:diguanylate cyclase [Clostridiales bacterium]MDR2749999.1 diguanylate cyclase [Clostridiales bacterium]